MRWTEEQEAILYEYGNKGPEYCARLISQRFHVHRSAEATKRHANRIGASMMVFSVCPRCGNAVRKLNRSSGFCATCNYRFLTEQLKRTRETLKGGDFDGYQEAKRGYDRERQAASREKRRYGDKVDMSPKMSLTRSEGKKSSSPPLFEPPEKEMCAPAC